MFSFTSRVICITTFAAALLFAGTAFAFSENGENEGEGTAIMGNGAGARWTGGNEGSPLMHPGSNCISCHASSGEGPRFMVAGTVFRRLDEATDVFGVQGAVVQITDAKGKVTKLTTNQAGNFFLRVRGNTIAMPFKAKVIYNGAENAMGSSQSIGNCAGCHIASGAGGAPGRIITP